MEGQLYGGEITKNADRSVQSHHLMRLQDSGRPLPTHMSCAEPNTTNEKIARILHAKTYMRVWGLAAVIALPSISCLRHTATLANSGKSSSWHPSRARPCETFQRAVKLQHYRLAEQVLGRRRAHRGARNSLSRLAAMTHVEEKKQAQLPAWHQMPKIRHTVDELERELIRY